MNVPRAFLPKERVQGVFAAQQGLATYKQLLDGGLTRSTIASLVKGRWLERTNRGVYRLCGSPQTWEQRLMAAQLAYGEGSWISHRSAAALHELTGYRPGPIELSTVRDRRELPGATTFRASKAPYFQFARFGPLVVADVNVTLLNLAAVEPSARVEEALDDALARNLTTVAKLDWLLSRSGGRGTPGSGSLRELIGLRSRREEVPQSVMETRMDRLIRQSRLPLPVRQLSIADDRGAEVGRVDFAYPGRKLVIECHSYRWHSGRRKWHRDLYRNNELTRLGWRILYFTWAQIRDEPESVVDRIRSELGYLSMSNG
jgi:very-short-patch-repair endonuclease